MDSQEFQQWVKDEFRRVEVRFSKMEMEHAQSREEIRKLAMQILEMETKIEKISISFRMLSNSVENLSISFGEMTKDLNRLIVKTSTIEERFEWYQQSNEEMHKQLAEMVKQTDKSLQEKMDLVVSNVDRVAPSNPDQPWYASTEAWKQIGAGLVIVLTALMTAWNTIKATPPPQNPAPIVSPKT